VESAAAWTLAPHLTLAGNAAFMDIHYLNGPLPGSIATVPQFDPALPSDNSGVFPAGNYRLPGQPRWQVNLQAACTPPHGWGARFWCSLQGPQNLDLFGQVIIPAQQTWNAGLLYRRGAWEFEGDVLNLTDEFNWRPTSSPFAGADLVTRELPRHGRVTVRYRF
jgi:outer membrane receptor protein involved in Fe transport